MDRTYGLAAYSLWQARDSLDVSQHRLRKADAAPTALNRAVEGDSNV